MKILEVALSEFASSGSEAELNILRQAQELGLIPQGNGLHIRYLFIGAATCIFTFAPEFERLSGEDAFSDEVMERHVDYVLTLFSDKNSFS